MYIFLRGLICRVESQVSAFRSLLEAFTFHVILREKFHLTNTTSFGMKDIVVKDY